MNKPKTLQQAIKYFSDEQVCIDTVAKLRWPDGPICPACGHDKHYYLASQRRWKCRDCHKQFSVKLGTIFEDSPIGLDKWLIALWMLVNCRNGISSYEVGRALGITQKSAWFVLHRLRLALRDGIMAKLGGPGREIEADETFVGGKMKNMHADKQAEFRKRRSETFDNAQHMNKSAVIGVFDRTQRKIRATIVKDVTREVLQSAVLDHVAHGSAIYTDQGGLYRGIPKEYVHDFVNHMEKYVKGRVHTNGLENFWSLLKRGLRGTYVAVEPFHLLRYIDEQSFRFNNRLDSDGKKLLDGDRFEIALSQIAGKRLTFAEVTGKVGAAASN